EDMRDLAALDPDAIAKVREDAFPLVRDEEELHDALLSLGALPEAEGGPWKPYFERLAAAGRATLAAREGKPSLWTVAERWTLVKAACPDARPEPELKLPPELSVEHEGIDATVALVRGRLEIAGPVTAETIAKDLGLELGRVNGALGMLEAEGFVLQGRFTGPGEWCERRLLARIHRLTLEGARKRVQPVSPETYWRFLSEYHHLTPASRRDGRLGLYEAVGQLEGFESPAAAWETDLLPGRVAKYEPEWLDSLSFSGELVWGRLRSVKRAAPGTEGPGESFRKDAEAGSPSLTRVAPIALGLRADLGWLLPPERVAAYPPPAPVNASPAAAQAWKALRENGALFFDDLAESTGLIPAQLKDALSELAALGLVTSDGFSALRGLVLAKAPAARRSRWGAPRRAAYGRTGRWTLFPGRVSAAKPDERLLRWAWQLLRRYGVVFRDLLARESAAPSWWELAPVFRRLEARGEVRGGRFVSGVAGEQFAMPEAIEQLRRPRDADDWVAVNAADPLNLAGILGEGPRVPATRGNRLLYHNGRPAAVWQAGEIMWLEDFSAFRRERIGRLLRLQVPALRDQLLAELSESAAA
ncbi:MAG: DEAD/DEAH box helicase, partial [Elusimicrobia bacterium]|nr:DEAD/DEAH box helicase [Elusimicrobiota bacterium]